MAQILTRQTNTLTAGTDIATANIFNAPPGFTPGGTDQVPTLDDEDVLTGEGTNPTLNFDFVANADTGAVVITPTLNGIETINVDFLSPDPEILDLQDSTGLTALNIDGVSSTGNSIT
ncbi:MAG: hypothetical protein GYB68_05265, partial [Chloroflexi bacterium]|nr:hypothetical protein [Chloroflexota bacterium]